MLSAASNCCRVDAVKASVNQLKMTVAQTRQDAAQRTQQHAAAQLLQSVDVQIKTGDANKAELALSAAKSAVERLHSTPAEKSDQSSSGSALGSLVNVYA